MYEETGCFDPNSMTETTDGFSQVVPPSCNPLPPPLMVAGSTTNSHNSYEESLKLSMEELSAYHQSPQDDASAAAAMEIQLQNQLPMHTTDQMENNDNTHLIHQAVHDPYGHQSNWDGSAQEFIDANHHVQQQIVLQNGHQGAFSMISGSLTEPPNHPTPDLLSLLHLPRCSAAASSLLPNSSISFTNPGLTDIMAASSVMYDPLFHLNLPPQPPLIRELYQSPSNGYTTLPGSRGGCFLGVDYQREGGIYSDGDGGQFDNGILEFSREIGCIAKGRGSGKVKHFATERERRIHQNDKFNALKALIPNPTKTDRASVVGDAIDYIKELRRTVGELKLLVEKKRCAKNRSKRAKTEEGGAGDSETRPLGDLDQSFNNSLRSSWLQRKSKVSEVDVRIIDDEVTIKLVQKKKINCLLFVSRVLDQLQLDLHHVAGGQIGEHYSYLFNTKIYQGSSVYASAIANTIIEVVDKQYMAALPTSSY